MVVVGEGPPEGEERGYCGSVDTICPFELEEDLEGEVGLDEY